MGYKSIGKRLQMAREEAGYNQEQLAAKIGCSQSTLSNYEKGKRRIYLAQLDKIAQVLNKPIDYFLQPVDNLSAGMNSFWSAEQGANPPFGGANVRGALTENPRAGGFHNTLPGVHEREDMLFDTFRSLSPEGKKLALDFIAWLKAKEVNGNG